MNSDGQQTVLIDSPRYLAAGLTDPGLVRQENEDSLLLDEDGRFVMLADGMGGHERGAEASRTALDTLRDCFSPEDITAEMMDITAGNGVPLEISCYLSLVELAVRKANSTLYDRNRMAGLQRFMGTTVVGLIPLEEPYVLWFHVGDSRLYRLRNGDFEQLTSDHSAYNEWLQGGKVGHEPGKNVITRAIGPHPAVSPEINWQQRYPGDLYLLCSDGLTDMISDTEIRTILDDDADLEKTTVRLVTAAKKAGGRDNVSAVLCRFKADDLGLRPAES